MDFVENALKVLVTFTDHPGLLHFLGKFSMYKRDSDGFISTRVVCRLSDTSYNLTDSLLVVLLLSTKLLGFLLWYMQYAELASHHMDLVMLHAIM